jgi:hypothetical protein
MQDAVRMYAELQQHCDAERVADQVVEAPPDVDNLLSEFDSTWEHLGTLAVRNSRVGLDLMPEGSWSKSSTDLHVSSSTLGIGASLQTLPTILERSESNRSGASDELSTMSTGARTAEPPPLSQSAEGHRVSTSSSLSTQSPPEEVSAILEKYSEMLFNLVQAKMNQQNATAAADAVNSSQGHARAEE